MVCDGPITRGPNEGKPAKGTTAGYQRHTYIGEKPCKACRDGMSAATAASRWRVEVRRKGDKAGRRMGEWCSALEHRMTPENVITRRGGGRRCRACASIYVKRFRKTMECTACDRRLTPEAYDLHQASPPGNPNASLECLSGDELEERNLYMVRNHISEYWVLKPLITRCRNGHKRTKENTGIDNLGRRFCRTCRRKSGRLWATRDRARQRSALV